MTEPVTIGWAFNILMAVLAFVGGLGVKALFKMSKDLNEIKTEIKVLAAQHGEHDRRITKLEEEVYES